MNFYKKTTLKPLHLEGIYQCYKINHTCVSVEKPYLEITCLWEVDLKNSLLLF